MTLSVKNLSTRAVALLAVVACLLLFGAQPHAHAATAAQGSPARAGLRAAATTFPITHSLGPVVVSPSDPFYEGLDVRLSANGRLDATQHVFDHSWFKGFNGGAIVSLYDASENEIWSSTSQTHGVDGMYVPFGTSDRYYYWTEQVPQDVLATPGLHLEIALFNNPQLTFWTTLTGLVNNIASAIRG